MLLDAVEEDAWGEYGDRTFEFQQVRVSGYERGVRGRRRRDQIVVLGVSRGVPLDRPQVMRQCL